jgi:hypothetical protein
MTKSLLPTCLSNPAEKKHSSWRLPQTAQLWLNQTQSCTHPSTA